MVRTIVPKSLKLHMFQIAPKSCTVRDVINKRWYNCGKLDLPMRPDTILEVKNLTKLYENARAVDDISFSVKSGEIVGLLGPNGAGKTTTINMILGLLDATSGSIEIFGKEFPKHRVEVLNKVNFAAAHTLLPGNLSVWHNLLIVALLYNVPSARTRVAELLREFDLERFSRTHTGFLSSGEQSRLSLAKALLNKPRLLLLDEPTASVDPSSADAIRTSIVQYVSESKAGVLWTSHNMYEIERVCDRVLFVSHGKIVLAGAPKELPRRYGKENLEELFIAVAREPLMTYHQQV